MTAVFITVSVVVFLLAVAVQSIALARGAARGDAILRRAVAHERRRVVTERDGGRRRIAA
jgi:hypothetical protein